MSTGSFFKKFVISDADVIELFKKASENPKKIFIKKRDYEEDKINGIRLLKERFVNG